MSETKVEGRCLCGGVRFRVEGAPLWVGHCHCHSCRRNTVSAVATFVGFDPEQVSYTAGKRQFYESSPGANREGLPLFFRDHDGPPMPEGGIQPRNGELVAAGMAVRHQNQ